MNDEEWRDVLGYEGKYQVSSLGRVLSLIAKKPPLVMRQHRRPDGYLQVQFKVAQKPENRLVHTLVDEAFNGARQPGFEVNHLDGDKGNNAHGNLERVTRVQNIRHAHKTGLMVPLRGELHGRAKLTEENVREIRAAISAWREGGRIERGITSRLAKRYGVARSTLHSVLRVNWRHVT